MGTDKEGAGKNKAAKTAVALSVMDKGGVKKEIAVDTASVASPEVAGGEGGGGGGGRSTSHGCLSKIFGLAELNEMERGWVYYDIAESIFQAGYTYIYPKLVIYAVQEYKRSNPGERLISASSVKAASDALMIPLSVIMFMSVTSAAEYGHLKTGILKSSTVIGAIALLASMVVPANAYVLMIGLLGVTKISSRCGGVVWDALIGDVTLQDEKRMHNVVATGALVGYCAMIVAFIILLGLEQVAKMIWGKTDELKLTNADSIAWLSLRGPMMAIALWWLIVGLFAVKKIGVHKGLPFPQQVCICCGCGRKNRENDDDSRSKSVSAVKFIDSTRDLNSESILQRVKSGFKLAYFSAIHGVQDQYRCLCLLKKYKLNEVIAFLTAWILLSDAVSLVQGQMIILLRNVNLPTMWYYGVIISTLAGTVTGLWTMRYVVNKGWISALRAMVVSILTGSVLVFWFFAVGKVEPDNPGLGYALDGHENVTCCYYGEVVNSDLQGAISISTDASNISESSMFIMRRSGAMKCASAVAGNDGTGWSIGLQMSILSFLMGGFYASTSAFMKSVLCMMSPPCMQAELFSISEISQKASAVFAPILLFIFNSVAHSNSCVVEDQYAALGVFSILGVEYLLGLPFLFCVDLERARKKALAVNGAILREILAVDAGKDAAEVTDTSKLYAEQILI
eukprot:g2812.t1